MSLLDVGGAALAEAAGASADFCEGEDTLAEAGAGDAGSAEATAEDGTEEFADCEASCFWNEKTQKKTSTELPKSAAHGFAVKESGLQTHSARC